MKRLFNVFFKITSQYGCFAVIMALIFATIFQSCKARTSYVPVESIRTEYINKYHRDSIQLYDSIYIREKGDTVWMEKYKYIYRDRLRVDTVYQVDSIRIPYPVVETKEVNRLYSWQIILMCLGGVLIGYLGFRLFRLFK